MELGISREIERIKDEYKKRDSTLSGHNWKTSIYHTRHLMGRLFYEHNWNALIDAVNALDIDLDGLSVLDVGCGSGAWLRIFPELGSSPENLTGIDLSEERIRSARSKNPAINFIKSDGENIPFPSERFDIVMQVVVFSSIIDEGLAYNLAKEMYRVLKPGGMIFWIDHKKSHSEKLTGYSIERLHDYFPSCSLIYKESVHPGYFRKWFKHPWLCRLLYSFTRIDCDSWFLAFRKEGK